MSVNRIADHLEQTANLLRANSMSDDVVAEGLCRLCSGIIAAEFASVMIVGRFDALQCIEKLLEAANEDFAREVATANN